MDAIPTIDRYEHSDVHRGDRHPERREAELARQNEEPIDLLPARGVLFSVVIGAGLWAVILTVGWLIFR